MPIIEKLPKDLDSAEALIKRRERAAERKEKWRDIYREAYEFTLPQREIFHFHTPGARKNRHLFDSTATDAVMKAANRMQAMLTPSWREWSKYAPGSESQDIEDDSESMEQLQDANDTLFANIHHSNAATALYEYYLDLMVGTACMTIEETRDGGLDFRSVPLGVVELEEGPHGTVETVWSKRKVPARHIERMWPGAKLSEKTAKLAKDKPDEEIEVIFGVVYHPESGNYYGVVIEEQEKHIAWRFDYGETSPYVVTRATVVSGELYGRGPVLAAMPDIKTINKMVEFVLRHSALQIAPPQTAVSDGVLNPYTARLQPNTIIPVASNDQRNPSLRTMDTGGNFMIADAMIENLRLSINRMLMNDNRDPDGPVQTATFEVIEDRKLMQQMGAVFGRIQAEGLSQIIKRCTAILQRNGKIPAIKVDGKEITLKYTSPLARAQDQEDLSSLERAFATSASTVGPELTMLGYNVEDVPAWIARKTGMDESLVRSKEERQQMVDKVAEAMAKMQAEQQEAAGGQQ